MIVKELLKFVFFATRTRRAERSLIKPFSKLTVKQFFFFFENFKNLLKNKTFSRTRRLSAKVKKDNALLPKI